ncbi:MAG: ABC transporter ATP-binding protein [Clostridiales bacterium]|nr:ABC transporter ATP-binding protein [Clostridiales bacterium]
MVKIENVTVKYKKTVLRDVNIQADKGECIGLLGLNGSGKSTLLTTIAGIKKPSQGRIYAEGKIGFVTQENALIDELNAYDNILMWTSMKKDEIIKALNGPQLSILKVTDFLNVKVRNMSGGMKKRLALASVFITGPDVLLMDEPLSALDIPAKNDILSFIDAFKANGGIIFIASHEENVFAHCDRVYHLKDGRCQLADLTRPVAEILND